MAYQGIGTGITPNDGTGDDLLTGAIKINSNFEEIYSALGDGTTISFVEKVQDALYNITTTSTSKTLSNLEYCTITQDNLTITLPSSPSVGDKVMIGIGGDYTNTTIARNGSNIMGLAENMVIDSGYVTLSLIYINSTLGWRIS
jgi:hypothetical protein